MRQEEEDPLSVEQDNRGRRCHLARLDDVLFRKDDELDCDRGCYAMGLEMAEQET